MMWRATAVALLALIAGSAAAAPALRPEPRIGDLIDTRREAVDLVPRVPPAAPALAPLSVELRWPGPTAIDVALSPVELVVRYDRRLDDRAAEAFAQAAGDRLARFDWAYDSLVIRAQPAIALTVDTLADGIRVNFTPLPATEATATPAGIDTLALVGAQAAAAAGYPGQSRRSLARLAAATPGDVGLQQALAEAELASDRIDEGAQRYRQLGERPGAAVDPQLLDRARRAVGARLESTAALRDGGGFNQSEITLRGSNPVSSRVAIEAGMRVVRTEAAEISGPPGLVEDVRRSVGVGELGVALRPAPGIRIRALVAGLVDGDAFGGSALLTIGDPELQGTLRVAWHLPDFSSAESAVLGGFMNRAALGGFIRPVSGLGLRAEAGINRYGLAGAGVVARSTTVEGSAEYLLRRQRPTIALVYRLEAEYVGKHDIRPTGFAFLPLFDRENHSGEVIVIRPFGERLAATVAGGWTFDRFGGNGPAASAGLRYSAADGWEAAALTGVSSTTRPGQRDRQIYGRLSLLKRFGTAL